MRKSSQDHPDSALFSRFLSSAQGKEARFESFCRETLSHAHKDLSQHPQLAASLRSVQLNPPSSSIKMPIIAVDPARCPSLLPMLRPSLACVVPVGSAAGAVREILSRLFAKHPKD